MTKRRPPQRREPQISLPPASGLRLPPIPFWLIALLAIIAALLPYLRTIQAEFVWDDQLLLVEWPYYRDPALFGEALWRNVPFSPNYFRPVAALTFLANYVLLGAGASGYHIVNILLHALTTLTFAWIAYRLLQRLAGGDEGASSGDSPPHAAWLTLFLTLLFAWHPAHVEAVAFVSSRFDLLSTLFGLLAIAVALFSKRPWVGAIAAGGVFVLALGAKEMAVSIPVLLWSLDRALPPSSGWAQAISRKRLAYLGLITGGVIFVVIRYFGLGYFYQLSANAISTGNLFQHLLLIAQSLLRYLALLLWPFGTLSPIHFAQLPLSMNDWTGWAALALSVVLLAGLAWALRRRIPAAWLWLAFLLSLLPVLNIVPLELRGGVIVAERFLYLPSAFFLLAAGASALALIARMKQRSARLSSWKTASLLAALLVLAASLFTSGRTAAHWQSNSTLWEWARRQAPQSSLPPTNLSFVALEQNDPLRAVQLAKAAIRLDPTDSTAQNNAGGGFMLLGRFDEAADAFAQAAALQPDNLRYWQNLADALVQSGQYQRAVEVIENDLLPRDPASGFAYQLLGKSYIQLGDLDAALSALDEAETRLPDPTVLREDRVVALAASGRGEELISYLDQSPVQYVDEWARVGDMLALAGDPEHALIAYERAQSPGDTIQGVLDARSLLQTQIQSGEIYLQLGDLAGAERTAIAMLSANPAEPRAHKMLGDVLLRSRSFSAALGAYKQADKLAPDTPAILDALGEAYAALGNIAEAEANFQRTAELAPNFAAVHFKWGELLWNSGDRQAARPHFQRYLELAPEGAFAEQARSHLAP